MILALSECVVLCSIQPAISQHLLLVWLRQCNLHRPRCSQACQLHGSERQLCCLHSPMSASGFDLLLESSLATGPTLSDLWPGLQPFDECRKNGSCLNLAIRSWSRQGHALRPLKGNTHLWAMWGEIDHQPIARTRTERDRSYYWTCNVWWMSRWRDNRLCDR